MILFAAAGSWGEVQPLLALANHCGGRFSCDDLWTAEAEKHCVEVRSLCGPLRHNHTVAGFLECLPMREIFESLYRQSEGAIAIVSSFYLWPAKIVAELRGIPWIATTTSQTYFKNEADATLSMLAIAMELNTIRAANHLMHDEMMLATSNTVGLFPSFLAPGPAFPVIGYPRVDTNKHLTIKPMRDYCVVSQGSISDHEAIEDAKAACRQMNLGCVYLGHGFMDSADVFGVPFDSRLDHIGLMRGAKAAIIHGGIGTLCDAIDARVPMIVRPLYFDNFYNAEALKKRGAALWPSLEYNNVDAKIEPNVEIFADFDAILREVLRTA